MAENKFLATTWLKTNSFRASSAVTKENTSLLEHTATKEPSLEETLTGFLISGWRGEGIISKSAMNIKNVLYELLPEAQEMCKNSRALNNSLKIAVYNEFISYAAAESMNCPELDSYVNFWKHLQMENSPHEAVLSAFFKLYAFRAVTTYLFKIRFIVHLCKGLSTPTSENILLNPNSFLEKTFKKGSSTELLCESLQSNQYSWYRPSVKFSSKIEKLASDFHLISITEMMKICTYNPETLEKDAKKLEFDDCEYSHSLSHRAFGLFINDVMLFFPYWISGKQYPQTNPVGKPPTVINCKFVGDHLTSLTLSHWLAQEHNLKDKSNHWSELLCPNFLGNNFSTGKFIKICHELQFMTFLVQLSVFQNKELLKTLCVTMREKYSRFEHAQQQMSIFPQYEIKSDLVYNRIVLNLSSAPKNNPHHHLLAQINGQLSSLSENGYLYVLTNQQIFLPSKNEKVVQVLKSYKLEATFNFDELKGRGEIPAFLYIFSKRQQHSLRTNPGMLPNSDKEACLTFRLNGELVLFNKFLDFVSELENFFVKRNAQSTPLHIKELSDNLCFEFHQDAIIDGMLLHSASQSQTGITHPNFFKNLTKSCIPFDHFFQIEPVRTDSIVNKAENSTPNALFGMSREEEKFPVILIVDQSDARNVRLDLVNFQSYRAKVEKYGVVLYQYFGLRPKIFNIDLNIFKEFFSSALGNQIIQLSINGGSTKLKSRLKGLLIPRFFIHNLSVPTDSAQHLSFFNTKAEELLDMHPDFIINNFKSLEQLSYSLSRNFPANVISYLSAFKNGLTDASAKLQLKDKAENNDAVNFNTPTIVESLMRTKSNKIYPNNQDIFVEFKVATSSDIHLPLSESLVGSTHDGYYLELVSGSRLIAVLHADPAMISFIKFILDSAMGVRISDLLQNLKVPSTTDLKEILSSFIKLKECFADLHKRTNDLIASILVQQISQPPTQEKHP